MCKTLHRIEVDPVPQEYDVIVAGVGGKGSAATATSRHAAFGCWPSSSTNSGMGSDRHMGSRASFASPTSRTRRTCRCCVGLSPSGASWRPASTNRCCTSRVGWTWARREAWYSRGRCAAAASTTTRTRCSTPPLWRPVSRDGGRRRMRWRCSNPTPDSSRRNAAFGPTPIGRGRWAPRFAPGKRSSPTKPTAGACGSARIAGSTRRRNSCCRLVRGCPTSPRYCARC